MSGRRHKARGRKQVITLLWGACLLALLVACNGSAPPAEIVSVADPLDGRLSCPPGGKTPCKYIVRLMAAHAPLNPDIYADLLLAAEFSGLNSAAESLPVIDNDDDNKTNHIKVDMPFIAEQEWEEVTITLDADPELVHSGCYVIQLHIEDTNLPQAIEDETELFVNYENGQPLYFDSEQKFLNSMDATFVEGAHPQIAYDVRFLPEDPQRGVLMVKIAGKAEHKIDQSHLTVLTRSGLIFDGLHNTDYDPVSNLAVKSAIGPILPHGYRVLVIPFQIDPNSNPGSRLIVAMLEYNLENDSETERLIEIAPIGIGWTQNGAGTPRLIEEPKDSAIKNDLRDIFPEAELERILGSFPSPNPAPELEAEQNANITTVPESNPAAGIGGGAEILNFQCADGSNDLEWYAVNDRSISLLDLYLALSPQLGSMTMRQFIAHMQQKNPQLGNSSYPESGTIGLRAGDTYIIPRCVSN